MQEKATVFDTWTIETPLGTGTYGKTYEITDLNGNKGVYKIMKIPVVNNSDPTSFPVVTQEDCLKQLRKDLLSSMKYIRMNDGGKYFVSYEDCIFTPSEDNKFLSVGIRMEKLLSLSEIIARTQLTEDEIIILAINVCRCLEKCRQMDYVYTNLKPNNIFITEKGCKLGDFGTFGMYEPKNIGVAMRKSQKYMAPEMIKSGEINETGDTYSLAVIMYTLLSSGRIPFIPVYVTEPGISDESFAIEKRCSNTVVPDPDSGSSELKKIIRKACSARPDDRYQTPTEMKNDLLALIGQEKEENPVPKAPEKEEIAEEIKTESEKSKEEAEKSISLDKVKTYRYEDKKIKSPIDNKRKILLTAISVLLVILTAVVLAVVFRGDGGSANVGSENTQSGLMISMNMMSGAVYGLG